MRSLSYTLSSIMVYGPRIIDSKYTHKPTKIHKHFHTKVWSIHFSFYCRSLAVLQFLMYSNISLWLDTIILCVQCNTADTAHNLHNFSLAYFQRALQCVQPLTYIYYTHHCSKSEQLCFYIKLYCPQEHSWPKRLFLFLYWTYNMFSRLFWSSI